MKVEGSYVIAEKRFRDSRKYILTDAYAAGRDASFELSRIPAGEYVVGFFFMVEGTVTQDGNGGDYIDHMNLVEIIDNIKIVNGSNVHLNLGLPEIAQMFKLETGQNPVLPQDIAASTGASTVTTKFAMMIPFYYSQWQFKRPHDFAYPSTLLQDATLSVHWTAIATPAAHASNAWVSATLKVICLTKRLNRATICPEVECGYQDVADMTFTLPKGNYERVWITKLAKATGALYTTFSADADGYPLTQDLNLDHFMHEVSMDWDYRDDELQQYNVHAAAFYDKNIPPNPDATNGLSVAWWHWPILGGNYISKIAELIRVEQNLNITINGTAANRRVCYRRYLDHTESGLDARAAVMGFARGSDAVPRVHRRNLDTSNGGDMSLLNLLPYRLTQKS